MSSEAAGKAEEVQSDVCCANCGVAEIDDIKLEECDDCDLVKYCSGKCKEEHREQHDGECRKRRTELHDDDLFQQSEISYLGECPICFLPLSLDPMKYMVKSCCSKIVCKGCVMANFKSNGNMNCPFCREPSSAVFGEDWEKRMMKRVKANDPVAIRVMGVRCHYEGDVDKAIGYYKRAAALGDEDAHYELSVKYREGDGVEKDKEKEVYHLEKAAIGGHHVARHNLGCYEAGNENIERSVKHLIIAANLGYELSVKALWKYYPAGAITKEELEATLRTHKAAIDETKSEDRDLAEKFDQWLLEENRNYGQRM